MTHSTNGPLGASVALESLLERSGMQDRAMDTSALTTASTTAAEAVCCCGRSSCAYLEHNIVALEGLEKDLQQAARIGQALLARHEAYMAETEVERKVMAETVRKLETDKQLLEASNAKVIEENKYLIDQLERLNHDVQDSDTSINGLTETLASTRKEMERLNVLASQTLQLEAQLCLLETEQAKLQTDLSAKGEESQTAVQRWKTAERTIGVLSEQVDRIEQEASEERARHTEIVARLERRRTVERELDNAAGRLKEAVSNNGSGGGQTGSGSVVSSFVKDILQDNANLQMGIVELRDMLNGSNDEVEKLRQQVLSHQVVPLANRSDESGACLNTELSKAATSETPDLHVHHHYHAAPESKTKDRFPSIKRPKKKRYITSPGFRTPGSGTQTPRYPYAQQLPTLPSSPDAAILSQTSVSIPPLTTSRTQRWSAHSSHRSSLNIQTSLSSSPQSTTFPDDSVFDPTDDTFTSSRPTTPASTTLGSPDFISRHSKRNSDVSINSLTTRIVPTNARHFSGSTIEVPMKSPLLDHDTIIEEHEDDSASMIKAEVTDHASPKSLPYEPIRPRLQRASSAESILSTRDTALPRLYTKHSQLFRTPRTTSGPPTALIQPVTSSTSAVGRPSKVSKHYDSSTYNRLLLANASSTDIQGPVATGTSSAPSSKSTMGKKLGGWMVGKWGMAPTATAPSGHSDSGSGARKTSLKVAGTSDQASKRLSTHVEAVQIDNALLEEALEGI